MDTMETVTEQNQGETILELKISEIQPNPFQPRTHFDPAQLEELASSIREYGVLQPVIVRLVEDKYQLVSGERRFRASTLAGKETIPALVRQLNDREVAEMALIENLQREDLNYFEEAEGYARLIQEFQITQEEVSPQNGKKSAHSGQQTAAVTYPGTGAAGNIGRCYYRAACALSAKAERRRTAAGSPEPHLQK